MKSLFVLDMTWVIGLDKYHDPYSCSTRMLVYGGLCGVIYHSFQDKIESVGIQSPILRMVMEPTVNTLLRRWLYTPIITWQGDWIPREHHVPMRLLEATVWYQLWGSKASAFAVILTTYQQIPEPTRFIELDRWAYGLEVVLPRSNSSNWTFCCYGKIPVKFGEAKIVMLISLSDLRLILSTQKKKQQQGSVENSVVSVCTGNDLTIPSSRGVKTMALHKASLWPRSRGVKTMALHKASLWTNQTDLHETWQRTNHSG